MLSADAFLEVIRRSGLLEGDRLRKLLEEQPQRNGQTAEQLADFLVQKQAITRWQAEKLLLGKHKGYYLGKYRLLSLLGKGGMSSVYLAEHTLMRRRCAIKVLPFKRVADSSYLGRFHREAQAVAALDHPNIVRAYDVDHQADGSNDIHFLVMEFVDGASLQELVQRRGPLPVRESLEYIRQAARGLEHAHAAGMVHRDIKPGNLLVDTQGTVKILDLGLARFFSDTGDDALTIQHDEKVLGTADYLAPEQALDSHTVDARADIYSLGCTLYFLLAGNPPFTEGSLAQRLMAHQSKEPPGIETRRNDIPNVVVRILRKMMAKQPAQRFATAGETASVLQQYLDHRQAAEAKRASSASGATPTVPAPAAALGPPSSAPATVKASGPAAGSPTRPAENITSRPPSSKMLSRQAASSTPAFPDLASLGAVNEAASPVAPSPATATSPNLFAFDLGAAPPPPQSSPAPAVLKPGDLSSAKLKRTAEPPSSARLKSTRSSGPPALPSTLASGLPAFNFGDAPSSAAADTGNDTGNENSFGNPFANLSAGPASDVAAPVGMATVATRPDVTARVPIAPLPGESTAVAPFPPAAETGLFGHASALTDLPGSESPFAALRTSALPAATPVAPAPRHEATAGKSGSPSSVIPSPSGGNLSGVKTAVGNSDGSPSGKSPSGISPAGSGSAAPPAAPRAVATRAEASPFIGFGETAAVDDLNPFATLSAPTALQPAPTAGTGADAVAPAASIPPESPVAEPSGDTPAVQNSFGMWGGDAPGVIGPTPEKAGAIAAQPAVIPTATPAANALGSAPVVRAVPVARLVARPVANPAPPVAAAASEFNFGDLAAPAPAVALEVAAQSAIPAAAVSMSQPAAPPTAFANISGSVAAAGETEAPKKAAARIATPITPAGSAPRPVVQPASESPFFGFEPAVNGTQEHEPAGLIAGEPSPVMPVLAATAASLSPVINDPDENLHSDGNDEAATVPQSTTSGLLNKLPISVAPPAIMALGGAMMVLIFGVLWYSGLFSRAKDHTGKEAAGEVVKSQPVLTADQRTITVGPKGDFQKITEALVAVRAAYVPSSPKPDPKNPDGQIKDQFIIRVADGTYSERLSLDASRKPWPEGIVVRGDGKVVLKLEGPEPLIRLKGMTRFTLENVELAADGKDNAVELRDFMNECVLRNVRISGYKKAGVLGTAVQGLSFTDSQVKLQNIVFTATGETQPIAISLNPDASPDSATDTNNVTITDCRMIGPHAAGIVIRGKRPYLIEMRRNIFAQSAAGIRFDGCEGQHDITIANNSFWKCQQPIVFGKQPEAGAALAVRRNLFLETGKEPVGVQDGFSAEAFAAALRPEFGLEQNWSDKPATGVDVWANGGKSAVTDLKFNSTSPAETAFLRPVSGSPLIVGNPNAGDAASIGAVMP